MRVVWTWLTIFFNKVKEASFVRLYINSSNLTKKSWLFIIIFWISEDVVFLKKTTTLLVKNNGSEGRCKIVWEKFSYKKRREINEQRTLYVCSLNVFLLECCLFWQYFFNIFTHFEGVAEWQNLLTCATNLSEKFFIFATIP